MVIGEHNRENDLNVNPTKTKKLSNMRASGKDDAVILTPILPMTLERAIQFIRDDEVVEVTPQIIRIRKLYLSAQYRKNRRIMKGHDLIDELMKEYNLEIDDIRWYLSFLTAEKILSLTESPDEITRYIWSGELDKELYNMEERYLEELESLFNSNLIDEAAIREQFEEASVRKCSRF